MSKEMLITVMEGQECRIAILDKGVLDELYIERVSSASHVGNIYKGRVTNVEAGIQAAFVDFGLPKNGFLHISDLQPKFFPHGDKTSATEPVGKKRSHWHRPPIQECLRRGQEVIVQITKEGIGTKGPTLTTYLSLPGRLLVMMPGMSRLGVSKKIEDDEARAKARVILDALKPPADMGFIIRTAGLDKSKREFRRDLTYLLWLWKTISQRINSAKAPAEIYQESDLVIRTIRDVYDTGIGRIVCDSETVAQKIRDFLRMIMPRTKHNIELYTGSGGLFYEHGLEDEIEKIYSNRVELPSGGSLVIDQTEALVAIDVNSGRYRQQSDAETTALKINQEAAREVARQLRLRDLGGVIVIDFIDMREDKNRRAVEKTYREAIKPDRAKTKVQKISAFGIVEMTRQRVRPSLEHSVHQRCPYCGGAGMVKSEESQALSVLRGLQRAISNASVERIEVAVPPRVQQYLANEMRSRLCDMEARSGKMIVLRSDGDLAADEVRIVCTNSRGNSVGWDRQPANQPASQPAGQTPQTDPPATEAKSAPRKPSASRKKAAAGSRKKSATDKPANKPAGKTESPAAEGADKGESSAEQDSADAPAPPKKRRRRGRRGGKKNRRKSTSGDEASDQNDDAPADKPKAEDKA